MKSFFEKYRPGHDNRFAGYVTKLLMLGVDLALAMASFFAALLVTNNFAFAAAGIFLLGKASLLLLFLRGLSFVFFRTYLIIIRFVGLKDVRNVFYAVTTSSAAFGLLVVLLPDLLPREQALSIVLVDYIVLLLLCEGFRTILRIAFDELRRRGAGLRLHTIIFGAGEMGGMLEKVLKQNTGQPYRVVAFFDDNPKVWGKFLNGVPIYDPNTQLARIIAKSEVRVAIIAINQLPDERRITFIQQCLEHQIKVLKVPPTEHWLNNQLDIGGLRDIRFEDLLNRPPILLDQEAVANSVNGKMMLVTGCAGSIGSEIVRQLLRYQPKQIIGLDQAETPLANLSLSLKDQVAAGVLLPVLCDVRNAQDLERIYQNYQPTYVFHAAAYKHVPIMERFPQEAIKANVEGTMNTARLARAYGVEKFVMISTDKVVNPSNVMGASKRIAEMYVQSLNDTKGHTTQFITTRFGNVLGSNGSVIPIFRRQIEKRQPVTVTHPEVTRFFMTIPEACQLVLEAGAMGRGGEIFLFDMGKAVRINDLAEKMIQIAGLRPGHDIKIVYTGLRPGEKLYEELLDDGENTLATHHPKIRKAQVRTLSHTKIVPTIKELIHLSRQGAPGREIVTLMKQLVPEYLSLNSEFSVLDKEGAAEGNSAKD
ncbi:MAG: nucleoside-diphosphate sugar epimerase/dehydratase [Saprospiraceae bacterium]